MKNKRRLIKAFGEDEYGFPYLPAKVSGATIDRIFMKVGCTLCFPHGIETSNSHWKNRQRSWKTHRKTQYK